MLLLRWLPYWGCMTHAPQSDRNKHWLHLLRAPRILDASSCTWEVCPPSHWGVDGKPPHVLSSVVCARKCVRCRQFPRHLGGQGTPAPRPVGNFPFGKHCVQRLPLGRESPRQQVPFWCVPRWGSMGRRGTAFLLLFQGDVSGEQQH